MRSYIFTPAERRAIRLFLEGSLKASDPKVAYIISRVKGFRDLAGDVDLYIRLREAISTAST